MTIIVVFAISVLFYMQGIFLSKNNLTDKSVPLSSEGGLSSRSKTKVIMLLVDALREDFVEMDTNITHYLDPRISVYRGRKLQLFNDLLLE